MAALESIGVTLSVGILPRTGFRFPLVADFLGRCGIAPELGKPVETVRNQSFHPGLVEAVLNAIEAGHPMPGPHQAKAFFNRSSTQEIQNLEIGGTLLNRLKSHIDTAFEPGNLRLAQALGLPPDYFATEERAGSETMRAEIAQEAEIRETVPRYLRERDRLSRVALAQIAWKTFRAGQQ